MMLFKFNSITLLKSYFSTNILLQLLTFLFFNIYILVFLSLF